MTDVDDIELEGGAASAQEPLLPAGTLIDAKYSIERSLGRGGTGTVYEARHAAIGHRVALKIVNADRAQRPETLARFQREAQICGAIRHPNVGQIYDVGTHDGKPYMVLELHEGQSLADVLEESLLPVPAVLEITLQVLAALAAIHDARVVHRDVKPDNVMLVRALNGDIVVKLVDFGISKIVTADIRDRTVTREGSILGSPDYMAPEQLRGQEVDARTDLYAVGVLLYEAITGVTPFDAENLSDLMVAILRDPVDPPRELRPDCPPELNALILKALSREPEDRFQSAVEMARELEQLRGAARTSLPPPGSGDPRLPRPRRSERVTSMRRAKRKRGEAQAAPIAGASSEAAPAPPSEVAPKRRISTGLMLGIGAAVVLAIAVASAPRDRGEDVVAAPLAATPPSPPALTATAAPPSIELELEPSAPAATGADASAAADASAQPLARSSKKRDRPAKPERDSTAEPDATSVREQLAAASAAFVRGQMPLAKTLYQQILERSPAQPEALRGLGLVANRMGQTKDAERAFERYLELRPNAPDAARIREQLAKLR